MALITWLLGAAAAGRRVLPQRGGLAEVRLLPGLPQALPLFSFVEPH